MWALQAFMLPPPPLQPQVFANQHLQIQQQHRQQQQQQQQGFHQQLRSPNVRVHNDPTPRLFKLVGDANKKISFAKLASPQITYKGTKKWICRNFVTVGRRCGRRDNCRLHHLAADWYNHVSHNDYCLLLNWVNNRPEITWNDGMDLSQSQALIPAAQAGGGATQPTGTNNNITEIP